MNVFEVLLEVLSAHGVKHIFGIPGDAINDATEAQLPKVFLEACHAETVHPGETEVKQDGDPRTESRPNICVG